MNTARIAMVAAVVAHWTGTVNEWHPGGLNRCAVPRGAAARKVKVNIGVKR
jgi:hypothetical protein